MDDAAFEGIAAEEWATVPEKFRARVENVALLVEAEPSAEVRQSEDLGDHETLLGLYQGISNPRRGETYGIGATLPDTITLYREPILDEADYLMEQDEIAHEKGGPAPRAFEDYARDVVRETLWHELGHYFGYDDDALHEREHKGTNRFS